MPDIREFYKKPHLTAYDLQGKSRNLTIQNLFKKELWDAQKMKLQPKLCVRFREEEKYFILGVKKAQRIASVLGSTNTDDWVGQQICLSTEKKTHSQTGEMIEVITISDKLAEIKTQQPPPGIQPPAPETPKESEAEIRERLASEITTKKEADKAAVDNGW